ncbi:MAG: hypothetical protein IT210_14780 [Armatimonadetes bacterium]|nr:hypothetical protein [Armatimonadota bacterium]
MGRALTARYGQQAQFIADAPRRTYHIAAAWGVTRYDEDRARITMARLDMLPASVWPEERDALKKLWFHNYIRRALEPESRFARLIAAPEKSLQAACRYWDSRREEFRIETPDSHLDALINWERAVSDYHRSQYSI